MGRSITKFPDLTPSVVERGGLSTQSQACSLKVPLIERFCRDRACTIQALGQSVWALLLAAYTGDANVTFGTIFSGTPNSVSKKVAFPSITTVPISCNTDCSVLGIIQSMVDYNALAQRHRFTPLTEIQRFIGRASERLFDTVFVYQKKMSAQYVNFEWPIVRETAAVDYTASLELETGPADAISLRLTFHTARIPEQHAALILQQYDYIVSHLVSNTFDEGTYDQRIYSILPAKELSLPAPTQLLHGLVENTARQHPNRTALEFVYDIQYRAESTKTWTYKELDSRGNQVAHLIQQSGVPQNSVVAVCMDKRPEASLAFLGILKAGCSFLAIDTALPASRCKFILEDSGASLLLVDKPIPVNSVPETVPCVELQESILESLPSSPLSAQELSSETTCYCLYTSGTSGNPKGCEISHTSAVQAMMAFQRLFAGRWTDTSRWLQFASYWFDVSVLEQFWSWAVGITVVGAPRDLVLEDLPEFLRQTHITHIDLTPSLARLLHPDDVPDLWNGVFITGGETLKQEIIDTWGSKKTICNGYGPTEATIGVTMNTFVGANGKPSNIGRQFDNVGTYVCRPDSTEPVLRGAVGELCVSGALVGKGYLNRPDLTDRAFPYVPRFDERVYRTGDLVRLLVDDSFSFIGRQDSQTKLRGQRLEIAEIDTIIKQSAKDGIDVVSLVTKADDGEKETLVSFLISTSRINSQELEIESSDNSRRLVKAAKEACANQLPSYMIPTHILAINFLPLTVNNKVDTKRLTALLSSVSLKALQSIDDDISPLSPVEQSICTALLQMLSINEVEVTNRSNLFSLGLSSISAISFSSVLKRSGFDNASVATIMSNPTLGGLSAALSGNHRGRHGGRGLVEQAKLSMTAFAQRNCNTAARACSVTIEEMETVVPCTPLQQGVIVESLKSEDRPYFQDFRYILDDVDQDRLNVTFQKLSDGAQILRTHFIDTDEGFAQVVLRRKLTPFFEWSVQHKDIDGFMSEKKQRWIMQNDPRLVSPFEVHLLRSSAGCILVLHVHHALYDGISFDLLITRLLELYWSQSEVDFGPSFTSALSYGPLQMPERSKEFWIHRLEGFQFTPIPVSTTSCAEEDPIITFRLKDTADIEAARKSLGVSHQAIMQACFEIALCQYSPSIQIYGVVVSGRSIELDGADQVLGPMFNTLPQPLSIQTELMLSNHIRRCHDSNVEALPFQNTPLRDIRKWCGQGPSDPMFDVLFVFQHRPSAGRAEQVRLLQPVEKAPRADYPLACEVELADNGSMNVTLLAQGKFFDQSSLQGLLNSFRKGLDYLSHNGDNSIKETFGLAISRGDRALQGKASAAHQTTGVHHFEWTRQAKMIRQTIAQLVGLETDDIDEHTTIFSVGLDSIDAVKLASRLKKAGMSIQVSRILQTQTIPRMLQTMSESHLAAESTTHGSQLRTLEQQLEQSGFRGSLPNTQYVERILSATPHQEGLLAEMLRSDLREYFNHDVLRLTPETDLDRLQAAWQTVIDASPVLRTTFVEIPDTQIDAIFAQVVLRPRPLSFSDCELESLDGLTGLFDSIRQDVVANIRTLPPLRLTAVTFGAERHLILSIAHTLYDGHSLAILHEDVQHAYSGSFKPRPAYDNAIEAALTSTSEDAKHFWNGTLSGATVRKFPRSNPDGDTSNAHRASRCSAVSASNARSFCQSHGVSMQALTQTCWAITLSHYVQNLEVLFGVVLACRDSEQAEQVMFPMMNTVVMRSSLHGSREQMLQYMQSMISDMLPYQRTPLRTIQAAGLHAVHKGSSEIGGGLFDTLFIYQHRPSTPEGTPEPLYESVGGSSDIEYSIAVEMEAVDDRLLIRAACKGNVLNKQGTPEIVCKVDAVLQAIIESPDERTVEFEGNMVSVCGLEPFSLQTSESGEINDGAKKYGDHDAVTDVDSPLVSTIMDALSQVSKMSVNEITPTSTIERIGIDSISAIKVTALLRKQSINLSVSEIIRTKTAVGMAESVPTNTATSETARESSAEIIAKVIRQRGFEDVAAKAGIDSRSIETVAPATAGQVYMISMWQKTAGQLFYPTFSYQLDTELDLAMVEQAWNVLVDRHTLLRTTFSTTKDKEMPLLQTVFRKTPNSPNGESAVLSQPSSSQPMVARQVVKNETGFMLHLRIHHALYDAVSLPILMQDFQSLLVNTDSLPPELKFEDFIALSITEQAQQARKDFWSLYLQDVKALHLSQAQNDGAQKKVEIFRPQLFSGAVELESIARKESLSVQALLFAAYSKVYVSLARQSQDNGDEGGADVVLGIYLSNRAHIAELDSLAAPTVNLVPLLVRSPETKSKLDVAREIQTDLQRISNAENSAVGLWEIAEWTGVKIDTFVNFLKLPERSDEDRAVQPRGGVLLKELDKRRFQERHQVVEVEKVDFQLPSELKDLRGLDAFQVSRKVGKSMARGLLLTLHSTPLMLR